MDILKLGGMWPHLRFRQQPLGRGFPGLVVGGLEPGRAAGGPFMVDEGVMSSEKQEGGVPVPGNSGAALCS